jgi:hypothetical protein
VTLKCILKPIACKAHRAWPNAGIGPFSSAYYLPFLFSSWYQSSFSPSLAHGVITFPVLDVDSLFLLDNVICWLTYFFWKRVFLFWVLLSIVFLFSTFMYSECFLLLFELFLIVQHWPARFFIVSGRKMICSFEKRVFSSKAICHLLARVPLKCKP